MIKNINRLQLLTVVLLFFFFIPFFVLAETTTDVSEKEKVRAFFADNKAMLEIAQCESGSRQTTDSGAVLRGGLGGKMIGVFQLHEAYHRIPAESLGFDIDTIEGNLEYAKHLYSKEGLTPWKACLHAVTNPEVTKTKEKSKISTDTRESLLAQIEYLEHKILLLRIQLLTQQYELLKNKQKK